MEAHRQLGRYGGGGPNDLFDYARLDIDHPTTEGWASLKRHYRDINDAFRDAERAARNGDRQAFEYHMHEVQDYYAHVAAGYDYGTLGHLGGICDDPNIVWNRDRYEQAEAATLILEDEWDAYNPDPNNPEDVSDPPNGS